MFAFSTVLSFLTTRREEKGATAVEYALIVALMAAAIVAAVIILGPSLSNAFSYVSGIITGASGTGTTTP